MRVTSSQRRFLATLCCVGVIGGCYDFNYATVCASYLRADESSPTAPDDMIGLELVYGNLVGIGVYCDDGTTLETVFVGTDIGMGSLLLFGGSVNSWYLVARPVLGLWTSSDTGSDLGLLTGIRLGYGFPVLDGPGTTNLVLGLEVGGLWFHDIAGDEDLDVFIAGANVTWHF